MRECERVGCLPPVAWQPFRRGSGTGKLFYFGVNMSEGKVFFMNNYKFYEYSFYTVGM